jgi:hypothetical protein
VSCICATIVPKKQFAVCVTRYAARIPYRFRTMTVPLPNDPSQRYPKVSQNEKSQLSVAQKASYEIPIYAILSKPNPVQTHYLEKNEISFCAATESNDSTGVFARIVP